MHIIDCPIKYLNAIISQPDNLHQLRKGLASLPAPKNDYEIVVPEDEQGGDGEIRGARHAIEDQADVDERADWEKEQKRLAELKQRSQVIQRGLPRPSDINTNIMRPSGTNDPPLTELQKVPLFIYN